MYNPRLPVHRKLLSKNSNPYPSPIDAYRYTDSLQAYPGLFGVWFVLFSLDSGFDWVPCIGGGRGGGSSSSPCSSYSSKSSAKSAKRGSASTVSVFQIRHD